MSSTPRSRTLARIHRSDLWASSRRETVRALPPPCTSLRVPGASWRAPGISCRLRSSRLRSSSRVPVPGHPTESRLSGPCASSYLGGTRTSVGRAVVHVPVGSCAMSASTGVTSNHGGSRVHRGRGARMQAAAEEGDYGWFVGIDWATDAHEVCILTPSREIVTQRKVEHNGPAVTGFLDQLARLCEGNPARVAISIEIPRGAVVESLVERGFHVYAARSSNAPRVSGTWSVCSTRSPSEGRRRGSRASIVTSRSFAPWSGSGRKWPPRCSQRLRRPSATGTITHCARTPASRR